MLGILGFRGACGGVEGEAWDPQAQPPRLLLPQMRTVTRVSIRKAPCKRAPNPALGAPPSPAALCHLLDHQKGSQRMLSPQGWAKREVGPGDSRQPSPLSLVLCKVEPSGLPVPVPVPVPLLCYSLPEAFPDSYRKSPPYLL